MAQLCNQHPLAPECSFIRQRHGDQLEPLAETPVWVHDLRIQRAVVAAPAAGYLFGPSGLSRVTIPIQLWRAAADEEAPDAWNSAAVRRGLPTTPELHTVPNAGHYSFLPRCNALRQVALSICTDPPGFDRATFHKQFSKEVVAFFSQMPGGGE